MCAVRGISSRLFRRVEAEACFTGHGGARAITCIGNISKYAVIFSHKSNTAFGTVKVLLLLVCTHNINKTLCFYKIKKKKNWMLSAVSVLSRSASDKPKLSEYLPH